MVNVKNSIERLGDPLNFLQKKTTGKSGRSLSKQPRLQAPDFLVEEIVKHPYI